jgi:hypothetical protein
MGNRIKEATNMELIKQAAMSFGWPAMTACQPIQARQPNITANKEVVAMAA